MNIRQANKIDLEDVKNITDETIQTIFKYHQNESVVWAEYIGCDVIRGNIMGTVSEQGVLDFYYQHVNKQGHLRIGKCHSVPHVLENGKLELHEEWQWLNGDKSTGSSIIVELEI